MDQRNRGNAGGLQRPQRSSGFDGVCDREHQRMLGRDVLDHTVENFVRHMDPVGHKKRSACPEEVLCQFSPSEDQADDIVSRRKLLNEIQREYGSASPGGIVSDNEDCRFALIKGRGRSALSAKERLLSRRQVDCPRRLRRAGIDPQSPKPATRTAILMKSDSNKWPSRKTADRAGKMDQSVYEPPTERSAKLVELVLQYR